MIKLEKKNRSKLVSKQSCHDNNLPLCTGRSMGERSTTEPQVLLPATCYRFRFLFDMLSDYVNGNKRKTCFRNVTLYFRERLSLITSTEI